MNSNTIILFFYIIFVLIRLFKYKDYISLVFLALWTCYLGGNIFFGRSFLYSDFIFLTLFLIFFIFLLFRNKIIVDKYFFIFVYMILLYFLSGYVSGNIAESTFLFPLKNFIVGIFAYFLVRNTVTDLVSLNFFLFNNVFFVAITCFTILVNISSLSYYSVVYDRLLHILPGMPWNSIVSLLSLMSVLLFFYSSTSVSFVGFHVFTLLFVISLILIAGSRQGFFSLILLLLFYFVISKRKKLVLLLLFSFIIIFSVTIVPNFHDFFDFFQFKMNRLEDSVSIRLLESFVRPIVEYDLSKYFFIGDGVSNLHNIITTCLYRFGFISSVLFFIQIIISYKDLKSVISNHCVLIADIHIVYSIFLFIFFFSNFIANIWYQVSIYWYYFSASFGFFISAKTIYDKNKNEFIN